MSESQNVNFGIPKIFMASAKNLILQISLFQKKNYCVYAEISELQNVTFGNPKFFGICFSMLTILVLNSNKF